MLQLLENSHFGKEECCIHLLQVDCELTFECQTLFRSASTHLLNNICLLLFTINSLFFVTLLFFIQIVFTECSKLVYSLKATHSQFSLKTRKLEFYYLVPRFFCFFFISFFLFLLFRYILAALYHSFHLIASIAVVVVNVIVFIREWERERVFTDKFVLITSLFASLYVRFTSSNQSKT